MVDTVVPVDRRTAASVGAAALVGGVAAASALIDPGGPTLCPFRSLTGLDCPLCGATRAAHHLFRGDLVGAADFNVLFLLLAPALVVGAFVLARQLLGGPPVEWPAFGKRAVWVAIAVMAVFTVVRNLGLPGLDWMSTTA